MTSPLLASARPPLKSPMLVHLACLLQRLGGFKLPDTSRSARRGSLNAHYHLLHATPFHQALLCHPHFDIVSGPDAGTSAMHVRALSDCMKMLLLTAPSEDNMRTLLESQGHPHLTSLSPKQRSERQEIYKDYADGAAALKKLKNKKVGLCSHAILPCTIHSLLWMAQLLAAAHIILRSIKQTSNTALLATLSFPSLLCFAVSLLPLPLS